jgi:hypothetical protein
MMNAKEKRADERFASETAIIFSNFSTKNWADNFSMALNISAGGMCFKSRESLKPHTNLYIRIRQNEEMASAIHSWKLLRTSTLAQVRWCREISREDGTWYSIGVKYL